MARREITIDVEDYITNEDLVELVVSRDLVGDVLAAQAGGTAPSLREVKTIARDLLSHLMSKRQTRAEATMRELLTHYLPPQLVDALDAMHAGRSSEAICHVDAYLEPRPSADGKRFRNPCPTTTEPV